MLPFYDQIVADLVSDPAGGLVVLSSGLSLPRLVSTLLPTPQPSTILLLSSTPSHRSSLARLLPPSLSPSHISGDLPPDIRSSLYSSNRPFFVTPRVLVVDLLSGKVPAGSVAGLLILNAHALSDTSTESFIVRLLRSHRRPFFVWAFSDRPHAMVAGFAKAERVMKSLGVKRLHLWPRFQVLVSEDLEREPPEVVDIRVPLSPLMRGIQRAVVETMDVCLKELRKTNKVDVEDLTVENGLFKSFDEIVHRQLDPIWHTIGKKTKQLVADLRTLRKLVDYLVRYDAVTYLKYLDAMRVSEGIRSVWIFAESSYKIFEYAKKRVYHLVASDGQRITAESKSPASKKRRVKDSKDNGYKGGASGAANKDFSTSGSSASGVVLEEVLEESPKWKLLLEVLQEIEAERCSQAPSDDKEKVSEEENSKSVVLVACKDEWTCMQLQDCIKKGSDKVMREEWGKYLLGKAQLHGLQTRTKKKTSEPKGYGVLDGVVPSVPVENTEATTVSKLEHDALIAAATEMHNSLGDELVGEGPVSHDKLVGREKGKRKEKVSVQKDKTKGNTSKCRKSTSKCRKSTIDGRTGIDANLIAESEGGGNDAVQGPIHTKPLPLLQFYAIDSDQHILEEIEPSAIVVYHPDISFVREIEIYKAEHPLKKLKVYFLFYEDSTEVQKFEASIRRENGAFESLIRQKSLMMIPVDQDSCCSELSAASTELQSLTVQNALTRKAGGRKSEQKEMQIIVDVREFVSSLPNVLHQKGIRIIPVTLEVGDYILSPLICVERKSISDLYSSFASGRLYHQAEKMSRYYRIPVLLIEFSQDKSFSFQSANDIGDDVSPTNIISKLSLLVMHFPRLRLVWSRSLHATAEIFASLKSNQDEPDESKATRVGVPSEDGIVEDDMRADNYNTSAVDFLRRLPGVTDYNYRNIMDGCTSLSELALLPVEKLAQLMGGRKAAQTLRDFIDAKCPTML